DNEYRFDVGIDWASEAHQVCVLDAARRIISERSFAHAGDAVAAFAEWLNELAGDDPGGVAVAIEIPRGAVVETLVERGFHVYAINPKQLDRFRDRHSVAGAKDDRRDAFVLGDSLRTDRDCFRRVRLDDPVVIQVRELSRVDEDLGRENSWPTACANSSTAFMCRPSSCVPRLTSPGCGACSSWRLRQRPRAV